MVGVRSVWVLVVETAPLWGNVFMLRKQMSTSFMISVPSPRTKPYILYFCFCFSAIKRCMSLKREREREGSVILLTTSRGWGLAAVEGQSGSLFGAGEALSAEVLVPSLALLRFPLLAVALVVWLAAWVAFAAGQGALLAVGIFTGGAERSGLIRKEKTCLIRSLHSSVVPDFYISN